MKSTHHQHNVRMTTSSAVHISTYVGFGKGWDFFVHETNVNLLYRFKYLTLTSLLPIYILLTTVLFVSILYSIITCMS